MASQAVSEGIAGTNPEELIGAAHAGCFTMALSLILGEAGLKADHMETTAKVTLESVEGGFAITAIHLSLTAAFPAPTRRSSKSSPTRPRPVARSQGAFRRSDHARRQARLILPACFPACNAAAAQAAAFCFAAQNH